MKKNLAFGLAIIITLAPAAFALADDNGHGSTTGMMGTTTHEIDDHEGSTTGGHASSTAPNPGGHGNKFGILKHFGTTTPPGFMGSTTREASTSGHGGNDGKDNGRGNGLHFNLGSILNWIFGQPASTTVGDLQAQLASGTASTTPRGVKGFFQSLFQRLGWFK